MVRTADLVNESKRIANLGVGVDQDGAYGTQLFKFIFLW